MRRREFISLLGGAAAVWPLAGRAQPSRTRRVGVLYSIPEDSPDREPFVTTLERRLQDLGWTVGRNIQIDHRLAPAAGVQIVPAPVINAAGIERAITDFAREPNGSIVVLPGPLTTNNPLTSELAVRHRLPTVYASGIQVRSSGLMYYGPNVLDQVRGAAGYVDRILRGEKPADLPVQQPTKFDLIINLKAARAIGLDVPATVLARANEVIE
jgi:ABC-type uncharacterized transport system substrate-binding protein